MATDTLVNSGSSKAKSRNTSEHTNHRDAGLIDSVLLKLQSFQYERELGSLCVCIASCDNHAGVTTIASNVAIQAAESGFGNVLLVDANYENPGIHRVFRKKRAPGLVDHICDRLDLAECIQATHDEDLHIMSWGSKLHDAGAISPLALKPLFDDLRSRYQLVLIDLPAIDSTGHGLFYACQSDGVVLVVDSNKTKSRRARQLVELLQENSVEVIGAILNRYTQQLPKWIQRWL